jgi:hypothetical protein
VQCFCCVDHTEIERRIPGCIRFVGKTPGQRAQIDRW